MKKFRDVLHHHISMLEACDLQTKLFTNPETDKESSNVTPAENIFTYDKGPRSFTDETLLSYEGAKSRYERKCIFCSNNHWSDECRQYPDIKSRKNKLKDRCLKCMKLDHKVRECKVQGKICVHCGEKDKHHRTLCPKKFNQDEDQKNDTSTLESNDDTESGMIAIGEKVIMQTALMAIKGNDSIVTTRALFNTGNTRSYVTEEVANSLKLKPIEEQTFSIYAFGDTKPKQKTAHIVELKIQTKFGKSIEIKATVTK